MIEFTQPQIDILVELRDYKYANLPRQSVESGCYKLEFLFGIVQQELYLRLNEVVRGSFVEFIHNIEFLYNAGLIMIISQHCTVIMITKYGLSII